MKFKNFLMSGMIAALAAFFVVGCNENPDDPGNGDGDEVAAVTDLGAVSLSSTSVGLAWNASTTTGATYKVTWAEGATSVGSADVSTTSTTVEGLTAGKTYVFTVTAVDANDNESDPVSVTWAPAARYITDKKAGGIIRIYARSVTDKGSGIVIQSDGAYNALTSNSEPETELAKIHLIANVGSNEIIIGAPESFTDFTAVNKFRKDVQISDNYYALAPSIGLSGWYNKAPLTTLFTTNNKGHFTIADQQSGGAGVAFAVRWGTTGSERYARIYVLPGSNGKLVQTDTSGDPFVELQISYQDAPGVPYAKAN